MEGVDDTSQPDLAGVMPRSFQHIFNSIESSSTTTQYLVRASFCEIYQDDILDLLGSDNTSKLDLKENNDGVVYVKNLTQSTVCTYNELMALLRAGKKNRKTGSTLMNRDSSRSHCIFSVTIESTSLINTIDPSNDKQHIRSGKLNLVDLAGSERQVKTGAAGERLKEAAKINLSLSALGNVISALTSKSNTHIPYRDSKLTRLLQDSLGGNTKTVMIANIGPVDYNYDETISTLRFASRAKQIQNQPIINEDPKDTMLRQYNDEIIKLRQALAAANNNDMPVSNSTDISHARQFGPVTINGEKIIVDKIVERIVLEGVSDEQIAQLTEKQQQQLRALEQQHQQQYMDIQARKQLLDSATNTLQNKIHQTMTLTEQKRQQRIDMEIQLRQIEQQMIQGKSIEHTINQTKQSIESSKLKLVQQQQHELSVQHELSQKHAVQSQLIEQYESIDTELQVKDKKLTELMNKYAQLNNEITSIQSEQHIERNELLDTIRDLYREIALKETILNEFVVGYDDTVYTQKYQYNDELDTYQRIVVPVESIVNQPVPLSAKYTNHRAISDYTIQMRSNQYQHAESSTTVRYNDMNTVELKLHIPERVTVDCVDHEQNTIENVDYNIPTNYQHNNTNKYVA